MEYKKIKWTEETYPKRLLKIKDPPQELYVMGNEELLNKPCLLSIVGSRNCTTYGRKQATHFAEELSRKDISIVSGLAVGIDEASHIGALENKR